MPCVSTQSIDFYSVFTGPDGLAGWGFLVPLCILTRLLTSCFSLIFLFLAPVSVQSPLFLFHLFSFLFRSSPLYFLCFTFLPSFVPMPLSFASSLRPSDSLSFSSDFFPSSFSLTPPFLFCYLLHSPPPSFSPLSSLSVTKTSAFRAPNSFYRPLPRPSSSSRAASQSS